MNVGSDTSCSDLTREMTPLKYIAPSIGVNILKCYQVGYDRRVEARLTTTEDRPSIRSLDGEFQRLQHSMIQITTSLRVNTNHSEMT